MLWQPVTWGGLVAMAAAGGLVLVYYYNEKDRRQHTGKVAAWLSWLRY